MPRIHHATREIQFKVVYYGPGLGGKTTNLEQIHKRSNPAHRGKLVSLNTESERTLFFDLLPVDLGKFRGYDVRLHLCTVPGQIALARSPPAMKSTARLLVRPTTAALVVEYTPRLATAKMPATDAMLITLPPPPAIMIGTAIYNGVKAVEKIEQQLGRNLTTYEKINVGLGVALGGAPPADIEAAIKAKGLTGLIQKNITNALKTLWKSGEV